MDKKRITKLLIFLLILSGLYYRYFLYLDFGNSCYLKLKPSIFELSSMNIKEAIKILKRAHPGEYKKLCSNVKVINPNYACGGFGGGCYYPAREKDFNEEIHISTARDSNLAWTAAILAHETCHVVQDKEGRGFSENECYGIGHEVLTNLNRF